MAVLVLVVLVLLAALALAFSGRLEPMSAAPPAHFDARVHAAYDALPEPAPPGAWRFTREVYDRALGLPGASVLSDTRPRLVLLRDFLAPDEVAALIDDARDRLTRSEVVAGEGGDAESSVRTSRGAWARDTAVLRRVQARIHRVVGAPESFGEGIYVLNYQLRQKYEAHNDHCMDTGDVADRGCDGLLRQGGGPGCGPGAGGPTCGDRMATFVMYLKSPARGGRTVFPESDATRAALAAAGTTPADAAAATPTAEGVEWYCARGEVLGAAPRAGDALLFWNYAPGGGGADDGEGSYADGTARPSAARVYQAMHSGCPVLGGEKWIATRWIRSAAMR